MPGKIEGWSRRRDEESGDVPFVWENDNSGAFVYVMVERKGEYGVFHADASPTGSAAQSFEIPITSADTYRDKDLARSKAVDWMENHTGKELEIQFTVPAAEEFGIDYSFGFAGAIDWDWEEAFERIGFERIPDNELAPIASELGIAVDDLKENPGAIQEDNTYNYGGMFADDINFGTEEVLGGTLLSFKVHQGGDIRGAYGNSVLMFNDDPDADYDLTRIVNPQVFFKIRQGDDIVGEGYIDAAGYVEWHTRKRDMEDAVIWQAQEDYEGAAGHWQDVNSEA